MPGTKLTTKNLQPSLGLKVFCVNGREGQLECCQLRARHKPDDDLGVVNARSNTPLSRACTGVFIFFIQRIKFLHIYIYSVMIMVSNEG